MSDISNEKGLVSRSSSDLTVDNRNRQPESRFDRLRAAIKDAGGRDFVASQTGVGKTTLSQYMKEGDWKLSQLEKIADFAKVSIGWLIDGDRGATATSCPASTQHDDLVHIDYYNIAASAGFGLCADESEKPEKVAISRRFLRQDLGLEPNRAMILETRGDSMEPTLRPGDRLVVDTRQQQLLDGVHVIVVNGSLLVKRLSPEPGGKVRIASDNALYQ
uniref:S24 family peptidase n=1 Tax=Komagataeibacter kakiaceti TaxID=943261 RepID=UPI0011DD15F1